MLKNDTYGPDLPNGSRGHDLTLWKAAIPGGYGGHGGYGSEMVRTEQWP